MPPINTQELDKLSWPELAEVFDQETFNAATRGLLLVHWFPEFAAYCAKRIPVLAREAFQA